MVGNDCDFDFVLYVEVEVICLFEIYKLGCKFYINVEFYVVVVMKVIDFDDELFILIFLVS